MSASKDSFLVKLHDGTRSGSPRASTVDSSIIAHKLRAKLSTSARADEPSSKTDWSLRDAAHRQCMPFVLGSERRLINHS